MSTITSRNMRAALLLACAWLAVGGTAEAKWSTYPDCRLIPNPANDGDSFHVKRGRKHDIFRLYFVDAPETDAALEARIGEQAAYWDLPPERMHKLAEDAKAFTADFLKDGFTVTTEFEDARGNSKRKRSFAFVTAGDEDLALALVEAGLARIYGRMVDQPDGLSLERYRGRLRAAERRAREQKRGAWGMKAGMGTKLKRMAAGSSAAPAGVRARAVGKNAWTHAPASRVVLARPLAIYSLRATNFVSMLKTGTTVRVLQAETPTMLRIQYEMNAKDYEALCKRADLGP